VAAAAAGDAVTVTEKRDESRPEVRQIDIGKEAAMEAEVKAARERAIIPLEIRMKQFRDMLSEKEVIYLRCFYALHMWWRYKLIN